MAENKRTDIIESSPEEERIKMAVLFNHLILNNIFSKLDASTLKSCRSVCSQWADVGTANLGRCTFINVVKFLTEETSPVLQINGNLVQDLSVNFVVKKPVSSIYDNPPVVNNFMAFLAHLSEIGFTRLASLSLINMLFSFINNNLAQIFATFKFPVLKKLKICGFLERRNLYDELNKTVLKFNKLNALTELEICFECHVFEVKIEHEKWMTGFSPIFQNTIYSAPNLEKLSIIRYNFYPDLSQNRKITELNHLGFTRNPSVIPDSFSWEELRTMIGQTRDGLIRSKVDFGYDATLHENNEVRLPPMLKLRRLAINLNLIQSLINLPALEEIDVTVTDHSTIEEYADSTEVPNELVQKLQLNCSMMRHLNPKILMLFPNMKKLRIAKGSNDNRIAEIIESCQGWNLIQSEIRLPHVSSYNRFLKVLTSVGRLSGVKTLELCCLREIIKVPVLSDIRSAFCDFTPMDCITLSHFKIAEKLYDHINEVAGNYGLRVMFKKSKIWRYI